MSGAGGRGGAGGAPGLPWWPAERSAEHAGGREPLTRARIVEAALAIIDRDGLDALSMRRLGDELGAGTTSVYWHVANKDQLLDLVLDEVLGRIGDEVQEAPGDWRETMRRVAWGMRAVLVRHRNAVSLLGERMGMGPRALDGVERAQAALMDAGFPLRLSVLTVQTVTNFASGWAVFECRIPAGAPGGTRTSAELDTIVAGMLRSLPPERYPSLVAAATAYGSIGWDEQFTFGLERLLDGIELALAAGGGAGA
ncbi:MAG: TetR/AcrR family transcriptional regulator [Chloroflexota bacterium]